MCVHVVSIKIWQTFLLSFHAARVYVLHDRHYKFSCFFSGLNGEKVHKPPPRKVNCLLTKNLKDNYEYWIAMIRKEEEEQKKLAGSEGPIVTIVPPSSSIKVVHDHYISLLLSNISCLWPITFTHCCLQVAVLLICLCTTK